MNSYIEFFMGQEDAIQEQCKAKNKRMIAELVGRLYGSVSISFYHGHITLDEFHVWDKKIKYYKSEFV